MKCRLAIFQVPVRDALTTAIKALGEVIAFSLTNADALGCQHSCSDAPATEMQFQDMAENGFLCRWRCYRYVSRFCRDF